LGTKPGQQTVTATVGSLPPVTFSAQAQNGAVASVSLSASSVRLNAIGYTVQLRAQAEDQFRNVISDAPFTWRSLNTAVATVDANGLVTARGNGATQVIVSSGTVADTAAVAVQQVPASVSVSPPTTSLQVGGTASMAATVRDSNGVAVSSASVTWSSSAPSVASVDAQGKVTALAAGSTNIRAAAGAASGTATVQVTAIPVARVEVSPTSLTVDVGKTKQLTAKTFSASGTELTGRTITWTSSNTAIATVDSTGLVKGIKKGSATITATSEGKSDTAAVTVKD
jgi:uncharacterized protein YjdB